MRDTPHRPACIVCTIAERSRRPPECSLLTYSRPCAESEILRQIADLERGEPVLQATRGFDAVTLSTFHLRSKESSPDYRYMPDPELGPVVLSPAALEALRGELPELPAEAEERLMRDYGLGKRECEVLVALGEGGEDAGEAEMEPGIGVRWFEELAQGRDPKKAANWYVQVGCSVTTTESDG